MRALLLELIRRASGCDECLLLSLPPRPPRGAISFQSVFLNDDDDGGSKKRRPPGDFEVAEACRWGRGVC
jgi:hypothetical protein